MALDSGQNNRRDPIPEHVFEVLGNETRLQILFELWDVYDPLDDDNALSFSELYERIDYDTASNFSYHLDKLIGRYVRKEDPGYSIALAGRIVMGTLVAGWASENPSIGPRPLDIKCPRCGEYGEFSYDGGVMYATCPNCADSHVPTGEHKTEGQFNALGFPPAGLADRSPEEVFDAARTYQNVRILAHLNGVCPTCGSAVSKSLQVCADHRDSSGECQACGRESRASPVDVRMKCDNCDSYAELPLGRAVQAEPVVTTFYYDHGIELTWADSWAAAKKARDYGYEIVSIDPTEIIVEIYCDNEELQLTVNSEAEIIDAVRTNPKAA